MNIKNCISLLLILIGIFLVTSVSFAWVNPNSNGKLEELDIVLLNEDDKEIPKNELSKYRLFDADNIYPNWSENYTMKVMNKGAKTINYTVGIHFEKSNSGPALYDVLNLRMVRGDIDREYKLAQLYNYPLQGETPIGAHDIHTFKFTLSMDKEAGNEYQNLSLDVVLNIAAEEKVEHHDPGHYNGGNKVDPKPFEPTAEPVPEEPIPEDPIPEEPIPDENLPDRGNGSQDEIFLPQTGGVPMQVPLGAGIVSVISGLLLRQRRKSK